MRNLVQIFIFFILATSIQAQSPDSLFMRKHFLWDKATLPSDGDVKFNDIWGWVDSDGTEYAILGNVDSIFFIDVTMPSNPVVVDSFDAGSRSLWRDFKTYGDYCYMVADENSEGLTIFDMSTLPDSVRLVDQNNDLFLRAHNIFIDTTSGRLYALGTDPGAAREGLVILDIATDPEVPDSLLYVQLDSVRNGTMTSANYYIHDAYVRNDTVYASHGNLGYIIWDCTDLNDIKLLASFEDENPGYNHSSWNTVDNQYAIFAAEAPRGVPLYVLELSGLDPVDKPQLDTISTFKDPLEAPAHTDNTPHNPFIKGDTLFVSYYEDGVQIYDVSDINNISRLAYYDTELTNTDYNGTKNNWGVYPFFPSGTIVASDTEYGMFVLQVDFTIVPLTWLEVEAAFDPHKKVRVRWQTTSEVNNESFRVERSGDGISFESIAEILATNLENQISNYSYLDESPLKGTSYYRIKQVDYSGRSSYSEVVQVTNEANASSFDIFPNPNNSGTIGLGLTNPGNVYIKVFDSSTKPVINKWIGDYSSFANHQVKIEADLIPGLYYIQVLSDGINIGTKKLLITSK